jgi:DNA-binding transcriptional MerR regulator
VRHCHQIGLLPEPERDASGYRQYGAPAVVSLIKIRALADAGVPLSQIGRMCEADPATFAEQVERIDTHLRDGINRLETSRRQVAKLAAGDSLVLPPEVVAYLDRLGEIGTSERMTAGERDGWILMAARWPDEVVEWVPDKMAQVEDPRVAEAVDIMVEQVEQAEAAGELDPRGGGTRRYLLRRVGRSCRCCRQAG